jgi:hypothetical protein
MTRNEILAEVKAAGLEKTIFAGEGRNYTNVKTEILLEYLADYKKYLADCKKCPCEECTCEKEVVVAKTESNNIFETAVLMVLTLLHNDGKLAGLLNKMGLEVSKLNK